MSGSAGLLDEAASTRPVLPPVKGLGVIKGQCRASCRCLRERGLSGPGGWPQVDFAGRMTCGDEPQPATLVDFRGSSLSDAGSIPAISTVETHHNFVMRFLYMDFLISCYTLFIQIYPI